MRLKDIREDLGKYSPSDIVEQLEDMVDQKQGVLGPNDFGEFYDYLSNFSSGQLKRVATLLGTNKYSPNDLAGEIVKGELIAYVDPQTIAKMTAQERVQQELSDKYNGWTSIDEPGDDEIAEPTAEDLAEVDDGQFRNKPPAFPIQPGTPRPEQLDPKALKKLKMTNPAALIDYGDAQRHQPFIYANNRLYVGRGEGYHYNSIIELLDGEEQRIVRNVYYSGEYDAAGNHIPGSALPGLVGRIGQDLRRLDRSLAKATVISISPKMGASHEVIRAAAQDLLAGGYVGPDALICFADQIAPVSEIVGSGGDEMKASDEAIRLGELQVALHLGGWPNGKRLTMAERKWIEQQLGIANRPMKKHPMQQAGENAGLLVPGQRWWAPTSEGKITS